MVDTYIDIHSPAHFYQVMQFFRNQYGKYGQSGWSTQKKVLRKLRTRTHITDPPIPIKFNLPEPITEEIQTALTLWSK